MDDLRKRRGWSMQEFDDRAGASDRYWSKLRHADTPSGRKANWPALQEYADALCRAGLRVVILPANPSGVRRHANDDSPEQIPLDLDVWGPYCSLAIWYRKRRPKRGYRVRPRRRAA